MENRVLATIMAKSLLEGRVMRAGFGLLLFMAIQSGFSWCRKVT
jgi:hypothetical protein